MKVKTDLKAGSTLETLSQQAGAAIDSVAGFLTKANREARDISLGTYKVTSSLYNCVTQSFGLK